MEQQAVSRSVLQLVLERVVPRYKFIKKLCIIFFGNHSQSENKHVFTIICTEQLSTGNATKENLLLKMLVVRIQMEDWNKCAASLK